MTGWCLLCKFSLLVLIQPWQYLYRAYIDASMQQMSDNPSIEASPLRIDILEVAF